MLDLKTNAEIKNLNCRVEDHGDQLVPAIDITMLLLGVPVDRISSLCPEIGQRFYDDDQVAVGEINPFPVHHKIENVAVKLGQVKLTEADIKKGATIHLLPGRLANVKVTVQAQHHGTDAVKVMDYLRQEVAVSIEERQTKLEGMEQ